MGKLRDGLAERAEVLAPGQTIEADFNLTFCPDIPRLSKNAYIEYSNRFYAPIVARVTQFFEAHQIPLHFIEGQGGYGGARLTRPQINLLLNHPDIDSVGINFFYN